MSPPIQAAVGLPVQEPSPRVVCCLADAADAAAQGLHVTTDRHLVRLVHGAEDARGAQQQVAALAPQLRPAVV